MRILKGVLLVTILASFMSCEYAEKKASKQNSQPKSVIQRTPPVINQPEPNKQTRRIILPDILPVPIGPFDPDPDPGYEPTPYYYGEPTEPYPIIEPIKVNEDTIFDFAAVMPEFPGGQQALINYLQKNLVYPEDAKELGIEGKVFVSFVIFEDGSVQQVTILRGIQGNRSCENEVLRLIKQMPKWIPGKNNLGQIIKVRNKIPVVFRLD
jgi:TonB family protein